MFSGDSADRPKGGRARPIDRHVGARIRLRRTLLGLSQERLGEALGITFQQLQKYERGINRVGSSRLFDLSRILNVPVGFFFDDIPESWSDEELGSLTPSHAIAAKPAGLLYDEQMDRRETIELLRAYFRISDPSLRQRMFDLIKAVADTQERL